MRGSTRGATRGIGVALAVAGLAIALVACKPEPVPSSTSTPEPSRTASQAPSQAPTSAPTPTRPAGTITLPTACEDIYSAEMRSTLEAQVPTLNDPEVTMFSTQVVGALEVLGSGAPTIRCSWGQPSEFGLATNVTIVDAGQADAVRSALENSGFACDSVHDGTLCTFEKEFISQDDTLVTQSETHFLRGNGWVSSAMLNFSLDGYTDDIILTLWG